jgi:hypothetical protein
VRAAAWAGLSVGLVLAGLPSGAAAVPEASVDDQAAWADATERSHPGWEPASDTGDEAEAVAVATALEQAFDLEGARTRFLSVCESLPHDWLAWETACEGAARSAFGLGDTTGVDRALRALLVRRPDHELAVGRFPPDLIARADELHATLPHATLELADTVATVELDGAPLGVAPLLLTDLPAGTHRVACNGWSHTLEAARGDVVAVACPPPAVLDDPLPYMLATLGADVTVADVTSGAHGMESGTWVFYGTEGGYAVLVHEPATGPGPWLQAVRRVRPPAD